MSMNKQERGVVAVLILLMVIYMGVSMMTESKRVREQPVAEGPDSATNTTITAEGPTIAAQPPEGTPETPATTPPDEEPPEEDDPVPPPVTIAPETTVTLDNPELSITFSSRGGGIKSVTMKEYKHTLEDFSGPLVFDFSDQMALAISGISGIGTSVNLDLAQSGNGTSVSQRRVAESGLDYRRSIELKEDYHLAITEVFSNGTTTAFTIPEHSLQLGEMTLAADVTAQRGMAYLGIDTLASQGGEKVKHHGKPAFIAKKMTLMDRFLPETRQGGCVPSCMLPRSEVQLPESLNEVVRQDTDWVAVKSKFFVQIASYPGEGAGYVLQPRRLVPDTENPSDPRTFMQSAVLDGVAAGLLLRGFELRPGQAFTRETSYYVGPKEHSLMKRLGHHQEDVMEFGKLKIICEPLLWLLNVLHKLIPNYGVAIILLTIIIKIVFWPITHKSTEQMKRMATLQPQMKEIQAKFKDKPQKMQEAMMALYKEHKVNPMAGCLPMVVQIPVFIALFTVLRSAVELRYAGFLWIQDLSEPEGLFPEIFGLIPFIGALNILPIFMTVLTFIQQKLTPTSVDPQQQKIMMMMPVIFLFILYNMASGLVLYWSVNQVLSILQLVLQKKSSPPTERTPAPKPAPGNKK